MTASPRVTSSCTLYNFRQRLSQYNLAHGTSLLAAR